MSESAGTPVIALYLAGVTGISVASIAVLYRLFVTGFPQFLSGFTEDPAGAVRNDPASPALALAGVGLVFLLVALVVVFGAVHGPDPADERGSQDRQESGGE